MKLRPADSLKSIFRRYDIRGVYGKDITPDVIARVGVAISSYYRDTYAVGRDVRESSPLLHHALVSGLLAGGSNIIDVGVVPIGAIMYSSLHKGLAGAYVTASHLPPEWNGVKLFKADGDPMVGDDIEEIGRRFFSELEYNSPGFSSSMTLLPEYKEFILSKASMQGLRIVVDCGNGTAALLVPHLLSLIHI